MKNRTEPVVSSNTSVTRRSRDVQRGQSTLLIAFTIIAVLAASGLTIDLGKLYYAQQELNSSTQAAALAGAAALSSDTDANAELMATDFSAVTGERNADANLPGVTMASGYPKVLCLTTLTNGGVICTASESGDSNALAVKQQVTMPFMFLKVLGFNSLTLTSTATASARGGSGGPYNVILVLDTTASMGDDDSDSSCDNTRLSCALTGVQTLLGTLSPCQGGLTGTNGCSNTVTTSTVSTVEGSETAANVTSPVDEVSLMVFPGLSSTSEVSGDTTCPITAHPNTASYNDSPTYEIVPLSSDFRTSDAATSLYSSSHLVQAVGGGSCSGVADPGGQGTFYAGVIDQAQAQLAASARPNTKNVMVILSDGAANATATKGMAGSKTSYPSTNECHQAVTEAQAASAAGTTVYTVAYGAEAAGSGACTTDCTTGSTCNTAATQTITPCQTMEQMASSSQTFFSDYTATGGDNSCISAARPTTNLTQIFKEIATDLTTSRLIPNNTD